MAPSPSLLPVTLPVWPQYFSTIVEGRPRAGLFLPHDSPPGGRGHAAGLQAQGLSSCIAAVTVQPDD